MTPLTLPTILAWYPHQWLSSRNRSCSCAGRIDGRAPPPPPQPSDHLTPAVLPFPRGHTALDFYGAIRASVHDHQIRDWIFRDVMQVAMLPSSDLGFLWTGEAIALGEG